MLEWYYRRPWLATLCFVVGFAALVALPIAIWQTFEFFGGSQFVSNRQIGRWMGVLFGCLGAFTVSFSTRRLREVPPLLLVGAGFIYVGIRSNDSLPVLRAVALEGDWYYLATGYLTLVFAAGIVCSELAHAYRQRAGLGRP